MYSSHEWGSIFSRSCKRIAIKLTISWSRSDGCLSGWVKQWCYLYDIEQCQRCGEDRTPNGPIVSCLNCSPFRSVRHEPSLWWPTVAHTVEFGFLEESTRLLKMRTRTDFNLALKFCFENSFTVSHSNERAAASYKNIT